MFFLFCQPLFLNNLIYPATIFVFLVFSLFYSHLLQLQVKKIFISPVQNRLFLRLFHILNILQNCATIDLDWRHTGCKNAYFPKSNSIRHRQSIPITIISHGGNPNENYTGQNIEFISNCSFQANDTVKPQLSANHRSRSLIVTKALRPAEHLAAVQSSAKPYMQYVGISYRW